MHDPQASRSERPFVIRDPVHGYLRVAPHERLVVDHAITQRLRNVNQTGLAHLIYPEARTSRFAHSLGAMHLASRFLTACIEHASLEAQGAFFGELEATVTKLPGGPTPGAFEFILRSAETHPPALLAARFSFERGLAPAERLKRRQLLACAEAGIRLAALFHDLGHFPFSHDLEFALKDYCRKHPDHGLPAEWLVKDPHEEVGHGLATLFFERLQQGPDALGKGLSQNKCNESDNEPTKQATMGLTAV